MKSYLFTTLMLLSSIAFAGGPTQGDKTENGNGPLQDHTCQGGHNCNGGAAGGNANAGAIAGANASAGASASNETNVLVGQSTSVDVGVGIKNENTNLNSDFNSNTNVAYGGRGGEGGDAYAKGGDANQSQGQVQGQHQGQSQGVYGSGNSSSYSGAYNDGNNSSQSISIVNNEAAYRKNTPSIGAPAIFASGACTGAGWSFGGSGPGYGMGVGASKTDPQCQVRENARILAGLDAKLAIDYLCKNALLDVGATLGDTCKYTAPEPPVVLPPVADPEPPVVIIDSKVKG